MLIVQLPLPNWDRRPTWPDLCMKCGYFEHSLPPEEVLVSSSVP